MTAAAGDPVSTVTWFQLGMALIAGGALAAIINGFFNRKPAGASATKIITEAATSLTTSMKTRLDELEAKEEERQQEWRDFKKQLRKHEGWDRDITTELRRLDPEAYFPDPPPLYPNDESRID